jgi:hypothetical protein
MNRSADELNAAPAPPMTVRQRIFVGFLLLAALLISCFVVRFAEPPISSTSTAVPSHGWHEPPAVRTMAV